MSLPNVTATIASGTSLSSVVPLAGLLSGVLIPSTWTPAPVSFITSSDFGVSWAEFCQAGNELVIPVPVFDPVSNAFLGIEWRFWGAVNAVIIRSGSSASAINQTGVRTLTLSQYQP